MNYLLDTCVISELVKRNPDQRVIDWISNRDETTLHLSVLTLGELHKGIEKLPDGQRKQSLHTWVNTDLQTRFSGRVISFDLACATTWGAMQAKAEGAGSPIPAIDGLIAATALAKEMAVVTRNTHDMQHSGAELLNPWEPT